PGTSKSGSDGTRTRDLRRDSPARVLSASGRQSPRRAIQAGSARAATLRVAGVRHCWLTTRLQGGVRLSAQTAPAPELRDGRFPHTGGLPRGAPMWPSYPLVVQVLGDLLE